MILGMHKIQGAVIFRELQIVRGIDLTRLISFRLLIVFCRQNTMKVEP